MAKNWYMYANWELVGCATDCKVSLGQCPTVNNMRDLGIETTCEPLISHGFNIYFDDVGDIEMSVKRIIKTCAACKYGKLNLPKGR